MWELGTLNVSSHLAEILSLNKMGYEQDCEEC